MNFAEFVKNGFENTCFTATNKALNTAMSVSLFNSFHTLRCLMIHNSSQLYYFGVVKVLKVLVNNREITLCIAKPP